MDESLSPITGAWFWFASLRVFVEYIYQFVTKVRTSLYSTCPGDYSDINHGGAIASLKNSTSRYLCSSDPRRDGLVSEHDVSYQGITRAGVGWVACHSINKRTSDTGMQ